MTKKSIISNSLRGHAIVEENGVWIYVDTKQPTSENYKERPCGVCDLPYTKEGHDPCLGTLPNVTNACCGHGITSDAYIQFIDGTRISGQEAINKIKEFKDECNSV